MAPLKNPVAQAYLGMTEETADADVKKRAEKTSIDSGFINMPNKCADAAKFLNENRMPNPDAKKIAAMLKRAEGTVMKSIGFKKRSMGR